MTDKEVRKEVTNVSREKILNQISEIGHTLYGMEPIIKIYCLSKATDLTIMLLGAHATAKSSLARMWSITTGLNYRVVTSCFDKETEVLTRKGWKFFKDLKYSDALLTLNLANEEMEYQSPSALIQTDYEGKMLKMKGRWIDLLVTPNHKMVLHRTPFGKSKDLMLKEVQDSYLKTKRFLKTGTWKGKELKFFSFPRTNYLKRNKHINEILEVKMEPFLKFLGYYLAEGSYDSHKRNRAFGGYFYRVTLDLYNSQYSEDCARAMRKMGFSATISEGGNSVLSYSKQLYDYCKQFGHAKEKFIPEEIKSLSPRLLKILWESWNRGDGHKERGQWKVGTTVSKQLANDLQEVTLKIGLSSKIRKEEPCTSWLKGRLIRSSLTYRLLISHRNMRPRACWNRGYESSFSEEWIPFNGKVYCAQVPNHTLYVRRNGIPIWSGNSEVDESLIAYIDPAIFREKNIVQMRRGELMEKDHIIVDEFFLWLNKYRAKLHQLLEERTYAGLDVLTKTYTFLSNPLSDYYAGQIEEKNLATIDRLDLFVPVNQPKIVPSESMMRKFSEFGRSERTLKKVISWEDYLQAKEEISKVEVPSRIVIWLSLFAHSMAACKHTEDKFSMSIPKLKKLCAGCNENNHICAKVALSKPRFLRATIILAKGLAWLSGHKTISFKDINEAVIYTLPHRLSWIQEELSYAESLEMVPELVQQFNDEMLAWKNRGIFSELSTVIEASKKKPPVFDDKTSSSLTADVSEIHLLKEFVAETIQSVKEGICRYYSEGGESTKFSSLGKLEEYVEHSNLNPYEKDDLIFSIARKQKELCIQFAYSSDKVEKLIQAVIILHKSFNVEVDSKEILMKRFSEAILYCSELVKIREESGEIQIIFKDPDTKKMFLNLWEEEI